jgi:hypothetical protein
VVRLVVLVAEVVLVCVLVASVVEDESGVRVAILIVLDVS